MRQSLIRTLPDRPYWRKQREVPRPVPGKARLRVVMATWQPGFRSIPYYR